VPDEVWVKRLYVSPDPAAPAILHVRRADSPWGRYTVAFRDLLRADPAEAARYERTKTELAQRYAGDPDYDDYTRAKTAYFDSIQERRTARPCRAAR
jgi:dephospho-CoA kinase